MFVELGAWMRPKADMPLPAPPVVVLGGRVNAAARARWLATKRTRATAAAAARGVLGLGSRRRVQRTAGGINQTERRLLWWGAQTEHGVSESIDRPGSGRFRQSGGGSSSGTSDRRSHGFGPCVVGVLMLMSGCTTAQLLP